MSPDPFARPSTQQVRDFILRVVEPLSRTYRVELRWDDPERVNLPNGSFMVGIPKSEIRDYYTLTLPTWASPAQIVGMIDNMLKSKLEAKRGNWLARAWRWVAGEQVPNVLVVPAPIGLFMVDKFSTPKVI
jgi:hypothetical protein